MHMAPVRKPVVALRSLPTPTGSTLRVPQKAGPGSRAAHPTVGPGRLLVVLAGSPRSVGSICHWAAGRWCVGQVPPGPGSRAAHIWVPAVSAPGRLVEPLCIGRVEEARGFLKGSVSAGSPLRSHCRGVWIHTLTPVFRGPASAPPLHGPLLDVLHCARPSRLRAFRASVPSARPVPARS